MIVLKNKLYAGVFVLYKHSIRLGGSKKPFESPVMESLVIIQPDEWNEVQAKIKASRVKNRRPCRQTEPLLLNGLLYCGECGSKYTSSHWTERRTRKDGSVWEYFAERYRCISYMKPKERATTCHKTVYRAEEIDDKVLAHTKLFLTSLNREKLLADHSTVLKAELKEAAEQAKKIAKETVQKERELLKLKDEVIKVVMGESRFSESLLSDLIRQREQELVELAVKKETEEKVVADIEAQIKLRKKVRDDYTDWEARFDTLSIPERRAMLIDVIDRIIVYPDRIHVKYKVKVDIFENAAIGTPRSEGGNGETPSDLSFCPKQLVNHYTAAKVKV
jgi:hypothetical protein